MALFTELDTVVADNDLRERVKVSALIQAQAWMSGGTPTANQRAWAARVLKNPDADVLALTWAVVIANRGLTTAQILSASDSSVKTAVDGVLPTFAELG